MIREITIGVLLIYSAWATVFWLATDQEVFTSDSQTEKVLDLAERAATGWENCEAKLKEANES